MKSYRRIKSVKLAAQIIKFIARHDKPVSANSIADGVGVPVGTVMCHLVTLEDAGFVKNTGDHYGLGAYFTVIRLAVKRSLKLKLEQIQSDLDLIETAEREGLV